MTTQERAEQAKKEAYAAMQKAADLYKQAAEEEQDKDEAMRRLAYHLEQVHEMERYVG